MRTVDALLECYSESHRNATNKAIHWICVPMIVWSLLGILWSISKPAALLVVALAMVFYVWLSWPLAVGMIAVLALMLYPLTLLGAHALSVSIAVFVAAWVGQFIGHSIEGKRPSFFEDVKFLLIGPAWLLGFVYRRLGIAYWTPAVAKLCAPCAGAMDPQPSSPRFAAQPAADDALHADATDSKTAGSVKGVLVVGEEIHMLAVEGVAKQLEHPAANASSPESGLSPHVDDVGVAHTIG